MFVEETMGQIREKLALGVDDVVLMGWEKRKKNEGPRIIFSKCSGWGFSFQLCHC